MNRPKKHDNSTGKAFLFGYFNANDLCEQHPQVDDIFSGTLALKTAWNTSTRALSRQVLFRILQWCTHIDVDSINEVTGQQYAYSSLASYAASARVASKALALFIAGLPKMPRAMTVRQAQLAMDAPYHAELAAIGLM